MILLVYVFPHIRSSQVKIHHTFVQNFLYLLRVFRANATTAHLTISDWTIAGGPGGPIGQDILFNFIEVQPYYTGTSMVTTETLR